MKRGAGASKRDIKIVLALSGEMQEVVNSQILSEAVSFSLEDDGSVKAKPCDMFTERVPAS